MTTVTRSRASSIEGRYNRRRFLQPISSVLSISSDSSLFPVIIFWDHSLLICRHKISEGNRKFTSMRDELIKMEWTAFCPRRGGRWHERIEAEKRNDSALLLRGWTLSGSLQVELSSQLRQENLVMPVANSAIHSENWKLRRVETNRNFSSTQIRSEFFLISSKT